MKFVSLTRSTVIALLGSASMLAAQAPANAPAATGVAVSNTKIAVIDIDAIAAQSDAGKALFEELKKENEVLNAEKTRREQEIRELQTKAASGLLSADARELLRKDIERKTTDAERWLQDKQKEFQDKQQRLEDDFQKKLAPVVEAVAKENGIGLILRATAGLTFVLDENLNITKTVIAKLNAATAAAKTDAPKTPPKQ